VKWLNYPSDENTWESMDNLNDCTVLEEFIENRYTFLKSIINDIINEWEPQIEAEKVTYNMSELNVKVLDTFEPLKLKVYLILLAEFRIAGSRSRSVKEPERIRLTIIEMLLEKTFYYLRLEQLRKLKEFQTKMNLVENMAPINIEKTVDLDYPDPSFIFVKESFLGDGAVQLDDTPIGCNCVDGQCAASSRCCARLTNNNFAYH